MNEELTKLIKRAIDGDLSAFERVMEMKARQIIYISVKLLRNHQDGEDAAQEAMLKMYQHLDGLKDPEAFQSWMYQIITRTCIDFKRKQTRTDHDYLEETKGDLNEMRREFLPQEYIEDVDKRSFLIKVIDELPEHYRACLLFFYYEGLSYREIAKAMDITEKTVDNILHQAKKRIKNRLDNKYEGKLTLQSFQGAVALPVLTQAFQWDALIQTPPETVARVLAAVSGYGAVTLGAAGAGTAATTSSVGTAASATGAASSTAASTTTAAGATSAASTAAATVGGLSTSAKILIGLVATASVASGGIYFQAQGGEMAEAVAGENTAQQEQAIVTLVDMIGAKAAAELQGFVETNGDLDRWQDYLEEIDAASVSGAIAGEAIYTLYHLERQDKQLLILERLQEDQLEVAYHFTDNHEEAPKRQDLVSSMEGWRQ